MKAPQVPWDVDFTPESWQNGYCTGLENRRPQGLGGSNPSLSARVV